jgi:hypothetical protein
MDALVLSVEFLLIARTEIETNNPTLQKIHYKSVTFLLPGASSLLKGRHATRSLPR